MDIIQLNHYHKYLLAFSGGVDSCSLFHYLVTNNYQFIVVHINHHTRGSENAYEQLLVEKYCQKYDIKCYCVDFYANKNANFHDQARQFRLKTYKRIVKHNNLDGVILAHHLDDVVEGILMHQNAVLPPLMEFKTNFDDLTIYRPLLKIFKQDIITYAHKHHLRWGEDSSNKSDKYLRNYYRLHYHYNQATKLAIIKKVYNYHCLINNISKVEFNKVNFYNTFSKKLFIYVKIKQQCNILISHQQVAKIVKMLDWQGCKTYYLKNGYFLYQMYNKVYIRKAINKQIEFNKVKKGYNICNDILFYQDNDKYYYKTFSSLDKHLLKAMKKAKVPALLRQSWPVIVNEKGKVVQLVKKGKLIG